MLGARPFVAPPLAADTRSWVRRVRANKGTITAAQISAVDVLVRRLHAAGLRSQITRLNPMVGDALAIVVPVWNDWGGVLDLLHGSPTITSDGMTVTGTTQYIQTGVIPSTQTGWDSTNSHMGVHVVYGNTPGTDVSLAGCWSTGGTLRYAMRWTSSSTSILMWPGGSGETLTRTLKTLGYLSGHKMVAAVAGASGLYEEGVATATGTNPSNGKPTTELWIGNANSSALNSDFIIGGYHLGGAITAAQALLMAEIWHQLTQRLGRQRSLCAVGDSLVASDTALTLYQSTYLHNATMTPVATGGITSATCNANLVTAIGATPALKWYNALIWIGQNDGGTSYGQTTIDNKTLIQYQCPHNSFRHVAMTWQNLVSNWTGQTVRGTKQTVTDFFKGRQKGVDFNVPLQSAGGTGAAGTVAQDARDVSNGVIPSSYHKDVSVPPPVNVTAITQAANAQVTATAHGATTGDTVYIGATVVGMTQIQGLYSTVTVINANTFTFDFIDSTGFTAYASGGTATIKDTVHQNPTADALVATALNTSVSGGW